MSQFEHLTAKAIGIRGIEGTEYISPEGKYERDWVNYNLCDREVEGPPPCHLVSSTATAASLMI